jgi:hypothetical protein
MVGGEGRCGWLAMTGLGWVVGAEGLPTGRAAEDTRNTQAEGGTEYRYDRRVMGIN